MDYSSTCPSLSLPATASSPDRIYIFHLEPSKDSTLFSVLVKLSALTVRLFGADPSHCYLPHCSLSSFFVVPSTRRPPLSPLSTCSSPLTPSGGCVGGLFCSCEECVWVRSVVQVFVQAPPSLPPPPLSCISPISSPSSPALTPTTVASSPGSPLSARGSTDRLETELTGDKNKDEAMEMSHLGLCRESIKRVRTANEKEVLMSAVYFPPHISRCHVTRGSSHTLKLPRPLGSMSLTAEPQASSAVPPHSSLSSLRIQSGSAVCDGGMLTEEEEVAQGNRFIYDEVCAELFANGLSASGASACSLLMDALSVATGTLTRRYGYPTRPISTDRSQDHDGMHSTSYGDFTRWDTLSLASPTSVPPSPSSRVYPCTSPSCSSPPNFSPLTVPPSSFCIPLSPKALVPPTGSCPILSTTSGYVVISLQCEYLQSFMNNLTRSLLELPDPVVVKPKKVNHITVASNREKTGEESFSCVQRSIEAMYRQALSDYSAEHCEFDVVLYECLERSRGYYQDGLHSLKEVLRVHNAISLETASVAK
eukprot:GHVS01049458.1.p1 GENE.GHVS01049458.1~~GHVS01049458.1.p1  ORF type:complete len:536 (-),score=102.62 GHVS01049458.1:403-2010(-)